MPARYRTNALMRVAPLSTTNKAPQFDASVTLQRASGTEHLSQDTDQTLSPLSECIVEHITAPARM
jgi:hypothetical protein